MKRLLLLNILTLGMLLTRAQVTNSFPSTGSPTIGASNYLSIGNRMFFQSKNQTENGNNRGIVANNIYWDSLQTKWTNGTNASYDFAMMRLESSGVISFFNGPAPDPSARQTFTNDELESYRRLTIKNNGRIGIGTANPSTNLSVYQSSSSATYSAYPTIEINNPNITGTALSSLLLRSGAKAASGISGAVSMLQCSTTDNASQLTWLRSLASTYPIYIGYAQTDMSVVNGKVGIGTANPLEMLSVAGTVLAKKVRVSAASADWPDYVFDKDYRLMPLDSLSGFIRQNRHLPGIASAAEVAVSGVDLGDNQKQLLQKTEELTLYLIAQDRKISELAAQVEQLKEQAAEIEVLKQAVKALQLELNHKEN